MKDIHDVIKLAKFGDDRLTGSGVVAGQISAFPIDFAGRPYNTHTLPCERVIHSRVHDGIDERGQRVRVQRPPDRRSMSARAAFTDFVNSGPELTKSVKAARADICMLTAIVGFCSLGTSGVISAKHWGV